MPRVEGDGGGGGCMQCPNLLYFIGQGDPKTYSLLFQSMAHWYSFFPDCSLQIGHLHLPLGTYEGNGSNCHLGAWGLKYSNCRPSLLETSVNWKGGLETPPCTGKTRCSTEPGCTPLPSSVLSSPSSLPLSSKRCWLAESFTLFSSSSFRSPTVVPCLQEKQM